jgi:hypothetical protein
MAMAAPDQGIDVKLSAEEWALVSALRAVPESPLRTRVVTLMGTLLQFVGEPRCAEMQGDGVPCSTVHAQCDQCLHVAELLDEITRRSLRDFRSAQH